MADIADQAERERLEAYARAWAAYDGEAPQPLEPDDKMPDDNVRLDYAAVIVDKGAEGSIRLHEGLGFKEVGRLGKVGFKFNRWLGTVLLQKHLK